MRGPMTHCVKWGPRGRGHLGVAVLQLALAHSGLLMIHQGSAPMSMFGLTELLWPLVTNRNADFNDQVSY